jgi:hypothetical protein
MPRYAYSASEGAICHGAMSRDELKAGRLRNRLAIPRGSPYGRTQAERLAEGGREISAAMLPFSVLGYKLWIWITPGSGEASSGQITGRCKLSQLLPMIFTACMETLQSLSNFVILQCILNPVFLCGLLSRSTIRRAASTAAPASITCPLCPMMISAPQEPVRAKPRTAAALMRSARSRVRPRPRRSPIFVRRYQGPHAHSRAGT